MIKLSLPQYDPRKPVSITMTFYVVTKDGDFWVRGMGSALPGERGWGEDSRWISAGDLRVVLLNATNEFVYFSAPVRSGMEAPTPAGPYQETITFVGEQYGLDGTEGWFSLRGVSYDVVDVRVQYEPVGDQGDRDAQGAFT